MTSALGRALGVWGRLLEVLLFPSSCELCRGFLEKRGERVICRDCREKLQAADSAFCLCCGRFFEGAGDPHFCGACLEKKSPLAKHRSCARYQGTVKDVILLYKYRGFRILGKTLADFMIQARGGEDDLWADVEAIVPVPLHPKKERKRGFNQARLLAHCLARHKGIALADRRLVKVKNVPPQTSLDARDREANVKGAFRVRKARELKGRVVLLVDDVYTTGSTLWECAAVLKAAGVKEVRAITLARA
ncbi:MAG: ComF family protein [Acidobacteriota bacterium]